MAYEQVYYDAIGSKNSADVITPATLTHLVAGNTTMAFPTEFFDKASIKFVYTPLALQTNRFVKLYIDESDDGVNWFSRAMRVSGVDVVDIYDIDPAGAVGIYEKLPNGGLSTGGVAYNGIYSFELSGSKFMRLRAAEDSAGNHGTLYIGLSLINSSK